MYLHQAGIPAVTFGPGDLRDAHFGEESVELSQVVTAAKVLAHTVIDFCTAET
jgi:acetylornithine deacetylase